MKTDIDEQQRQELVDRVLHWRVATVGALLAAIPAVAIGHWLAGKAGEGVAALVCIVPSFIAWGVLSSMECPSCRDRLFLATKGWGGRNPFASKCLNCGLSLSMESPNAATPGASIGKNNGAA